MKNMICAMSILSMLLIGTTSYAKQINQRVQTLEEMIIKLEDSVLRKDYTSAIEQYNQFEKQWESTQRIVMAFTDHRQLELTNQTIYELKGYIYQRNDEEILIKSTVLKKLLYYLAENERLKPENIF